MRVFFSFARSAVAVGALQTYEPPLPPLKHPLHPPPLTHTPLIMRARPPHLGLVTAAVATHVERRHAPVAAQRLHLAPPTVPGLREAVQQEQHRLDATEVGAGAHQVQPVVRGEQSGWGRLGAGSLEDDTSAPTAPCSPLHRMLASDEPVLAACSQALHPT